MKTRGRKESFRRKKSSECRSGTNRADKMLRCLTQEKNRKRLHLEKVLEDSTKIAQESEGSCLKSTNKRGTLPNNSREGVDELLQPDSKSSSSGIKKCNNNHQQDESDEKQDNRDKGDDGLHMDKNLNSNTLETEGDPEVMKQNTSREDGRSFQCSVSENLEDFNESDWEDDSIPVSNATTSQSLAIEISERQHTPDSAARKPIRRASASEKESAELVHKVHLLCLLGRGRLIDRICDDHLIQAALLSLLPAHLLEISQAKRLTAKSLHPLVHWFHNNFRVSSEMTSERPFHSAMTYALETREGNPEEIAALSVTLFRALNLTTRFVSILDSASIKPDAEKCESFGHNSSRVRSGIFSNSTLMVDRPKQTSTVSSLSCGEKDNACENLSRSRCNSNETKGKETPLKDHANPSELCCALSSFDREVQPDVSLKSQGSKRKGHLEFDMELEMALSATAVGIQKKGFTVDEPNCISSKKISPKRPKIEGSSTSPGISIALGARKVGSPLYWAEVYCKAENLTGKWVHVDAVNMIIDGEHQVEAAAAACKTSLKYVVAFAGNGAKDVTRRYCIKWYKIASHRVSALWWDAVLAPLRILEKQATSGPTYLEKNSIDGSTDLIGESSMKTNEASPIASMNDLEDLELETRALTEPLPTNQLAYKNHQLYAIEKWLTRCQILRPKGPILGFVSGYPVYPRSCVQMLMTKQGWLREGLQIKSNELPSKEFKRSAKNHVVEDFDAEDYGHNDHKGVIKLYGKWQVEPLDLPPAMNGIVPKNERGQVEVWSEKCLPPGTVHLRLPRLFPIAKRLEIDYAPAFVGFEFRNGKSYPAFDGIVVCSEFKDAILEAYAEEEERREAEEKKKNERQALSRWYQLLSSILTRQSLNNRYGNVDGIISQAHSNLQDVNNKANPMHNDVDEEKPIEHNQHNKQNSPFMTREDHEHVFLSEDQSFDEGSILTKRCRCGFSVQVEEM